MIHETQSAQISQKQDDRNIYVIMKTMGPPGYHHNGNSSTWAHDVRLHIAGTNERINAKVNTARVNTPYT